MFRKGWSVTNCIKKIANWVVATPRVLDALGEIRAREEWKSFKLAISRALSCTKRWDVRIRIVKLTWIEKRTTLVCSVAYLKHQELSSRLVLELPLWEQQSQLAAFASQQTLELPQQQEMSVATTGEFLNQHLRLNILWVNNCSDLFVLMLYIQTETSNKGGQCFHLQKRKKMKEGINLESPKQFQLLFPCPWQPKKPFAPAHFPSH